MANSVSLRLPRPSVGPILFLFLGLAMAVPDPAGGVAGNSYTAEDYYKHGITLYEDGKYEEAAQYLSYAAQLDPDFKLAWGDLGYCSKKMHRRKLAGEAFAISAPQMKWPDSIKLSLSGFHPSHSYTNMDWNVPTLKYALRFELSKSYRRPYEYALTLDSWFFKGPRFLNMNNPWRQPYADIYALSIKARRNIIAAGPLCWKFGLAAGPGYGTIRWPNLFANIDDRLFLHLNAETSIDLKLIGGLAVFFSPAGFLTLPPKSMGIWGGYSLGVSFFL